MGDFAAAFGDSGSGMVKCKQESATFKGEGAVGVVMHIGLSVCPCDVDFEKQRFTAQNGVTFGTTTARAIEMAREAGLSLSPVWPARGGQRRALRVRGARRTDVVLAPGWQRRRAPPRRGARWADSRRPRGLNPPCQVLRVGRHVAYCGRPAGR
jgi:hypothetical protein